jgi:hypothetical protein
MHQEFQDGKRTEDFKFQKSISEESKVKKMNDSPKLKII